MLRSSNAIRTESSEFLFRAASITWRLACSCEARAILRLRKICMHFLGGFQLRRVDRHDLAARPRSLDRPHNGLHTPMARVTGDRTIGIRGAYKRYAPVVGA